ALLVSERGRLLQGAASGRAGMMAVNKIESHHVEQACENINANGGQVYVSVYNSPLQFVVSGTSDSISELKNYLEQQHGECTHLNIQTASHCPILLNESLLFKESLRKVKFNRPAVQVISNLTGEPYAENSDFANILSMHLTNPVQWMRSMTYLFKNGVSVVVDMGPQSIVGRLTKFINDSIEVYSFVDDAAEQQFAAAFPTKADRAIDLVKLCLVFSVSTPSLSSKSLVHASANYEKLKEMLDLARTTRITKVQLKSCIQIARDILHEKSVPNEDVETFNSAVSLHNIEA
ncbi:MAG: ACP S-malonyltransferase, partial [Flammeovirgaceae bacterium]